MTILGRQLRIRAGRRSIAPLSATGPDGTPIRHHPPSVALEVITVTNEEVLAEAVRTWVDQVRPGDRGVAERAALVALSCYRQGGTVREACRQANGFVQSWSRYPAHMSPAHDVVLRLVS
jgi:hypothetical protein